MALKIRTWSLIAVLSALVPLTMLFVFALVHIGSKEQALIEAELRFRTSQIAQAANERIAVSQQALLVLSQSSSARKGDWPALYEQAAQLIQSNPVFVAVTLIDENDDLLFVTSQPYDAPSIKASYPHLSRKVFLTGQANVSGPFKVPFVRGYRVAVSVPIVRNDRVTHVLRMILSTDSLNDLLRQQQLPPGWLAAIVDRDGMMIARSVAEAEHVGKPASPSFIAALRRNESKVYQGATLEGEAITSVIFPVFHGDWYASIAVPDQVLRAESRRTMLLMLMLTACAAALGLGMAYLSAQFIDGQTQKLAWLMRARRPETAPATPPVGISEFSGLYQSFRDIVDSEGRIADHLKSITHEKDEINDLYERAPCGYHSLDENGCYVRINQTELDWLGKSRDEVIGQPFISFIAESGRTQFQESFATFLAQGHIEDVEFSLMHADGTARPVLINATMIHDASGKLVMSRSIVFDITERKKLEQRLEELSNKDSMTGLCNRRHFRELADQEIARAARLQSTFALAILDVDHFKHVNDDFGHAIGDRLLVMLASILKAKMRSVDIVARIGGEEFAVLMPHTDIDTARQVMDRLREDLAASSLSIDDGRTVTFTVSIGVTGQQAGETDLDAMLARADKALYEAKGQGRNRVCT